MKEPSGEEATSPASRSNSTSPETDQQAIQLEPIRQDLSGTKQPDLIRHEDPPSPVTGQPVTLSRSDREDAPARTASTPNKSDMRAGATRRSRQATVESVDSSPQMIPVEPVDNHAATSEKVAASTWATPLETPSANYADIDSCPWVTPRETIDDQQPMPVGRESAVDSRILPILQVITPPNINQQGQYGASIPSIARWLWPGNSPSLRRPL